ncbi:MAG TPA: ABC transporter permease [Spirochaetota bacterium]|nr:ABC transporter permease [Spirochaetota bacterium]HPP04089.1 ABC transporter permease [Spirochaetota bacterium]
MIFSTSPLLLFNTLVDKEVIFSILLTLKCSLIATLFAIIFGIPLSYIFARYNFYGKKIIEAIVDIPVIIPHSAAGIALLTVWGRDSIFGRITGLSIVGSEVAIVMAMFFVSISFFINSVKNGFKLVDYRYSKVAMTLGATQFQAFLTVDLPLIKKSIISGVIMMWARGISEFGAIIILVYHPMVTSILIYDRYECYGLKYAKPVAVLLILICLVIFIIMRIIEERGKGDYNKKSK